MCIVRGGGPMWTCFGCRLIVLHMISKYVITVLHEKLSVLRLENQSMFLRV